MIPAPTAKADLHCHSTASAVARLGIQRSVGLPECATPPEEVYELAKARGMDFVTITDHDTIAGCEAIADRFDVFVSEELTAWFAGEPQAVHVLCYGITADDHDFLQAHARDLEACAAYLHSNEIACALAHPFFSVAAPLEPRHRRRLAELFAVWEVRNGSRARELNAPAATYIETHGGAGVGGSDDHAGVDIGRTWTETPAASTPEELLAHLRAGCTHARGSQGSAAKWAHAAMAIAARTLLEGGDADAVLATPAVSPGIVLEIAQRVVADGGQRGGRVRADLGPQEASALLRGWLAAMGLAADPGELLALTQRADFSHAELERRALRIHERRLRAAAAELGSALQRGAGHGEALGELFSSLLPVIPYIPAAAILGHEKGKLAERDGEPRRAAVVVDGVGTMHGVTHTIERLREHEVPGYEVEVIGTDAAVDRRLPAVAELETPLYPGLSMGIPGLPRLVETLVEGRYDLLHVASPGPAGIAAAMVARVAGIPVVGSYHTELAAYAGVRTGDQAIAGLAQAGLGAFYRACDFVLSPSPDADASLAELGVAADAVARWGRGVDLDLYDRRKRDAAAYPGEVKVLYAGRIAREKGVDLLADAFLLARERDPRLHLLLAGGGPEQDALRDRLGEHATFLGWLGREELARAYASADIFAFCSSTDTYGQVVCEAQASALPVVAIDRGGPRSLIVNQRTGWLVDPEPGAVATAIAQLAASEFLREQLARRALAALRGRTWEAAFAELARGYDRALARATPPAAAVRPEPVVAQAA